VEDSVTVNVVGAGFATEDGNEIGAFRRNFALSSRGSNDPALGRRADIHDFGHSGHGFWLQGPGVELIDNIASGHALAAFTYFTASSKNLFSSANLDNPALAGGQGMTLVGFVPLSKSSGNIAFASSIGTEFWWHQRLMNGDPSVVEDFTAWNIRLNPVTVQYSGQITLRDFTLIGDIGSPRGTAIVANEFAANLNYENTLAVGFSVAIRAPQLGVSRVSGGHFAAVQAIKVYTARDTIRGLHIDGNPIFETLTVSQLNGRTQYDIYLETELDEPDANVASFFSLGAAQLGLVTINGQQLYHTRQARDYVPYPVGSVAGIPSQLLGQSNQQLFLQYGIAAGGVLAPVGASASIRANGIVGSPKSPIARHRLASENVTSQRSGYVLKYEDEFGDVVVDPDPVDLNLGWNLLTRVVNGQKASFFVYGSG
jgi:hypothetical protein